MAWIRAFRIWKQSQVQRLSVIVILKPATSMCPTGIQLHQLVKVGLLALFTIQKTGQFVSGYVKAPECSQAGN